MAGFGNVLGNVAGGFEQARQMDAQRQFEAEQNRRAQIGGFLQKLAMDETVHPYTRNAAAQQYLGLVNTPPLKPWKPDIESLVPPAQPKQATPPAQPTFTSGAPGAAPQMSMPQPPPGLTAAMQGAGAGTVSGPSGQTTSPGLQAPPTPPSVSPGAFLSPAEVTQMQASRVGALTGAQAGAEVGPTFFTPGGAQVLSKAGAPLSTVPGAMNPLMMRGLMANKSVQMTGQQALQDPELAPMMQQSGVDPGQMLSVVYDHFGNPIKIVPTTPTGLLGTQTGSQTTDPLTGLTTKTSGQRQKVIPGQALGGAPGLSVPTPPPGMRKAAVQMGGGQSTVPTVGPPADNTVGGRALPPAAMGIISSQARNYERSGIAPTGKTAPIVQQYMDENGMVPHTPQQVTDYQKSFDAAMGEDRRLKMMSDLAAKVASNPTPDNVGSYDAALLAYHMGMTVGQVKGMRSGKDMVTLHEKARSLPEDLQQAAESWVNGAQLSPEQRQNFVDLAKQSRQTSWAEAVSEAKGMGFSRFPQPTPGLPPLGLWPGVLNRQQITKAATDHHVSYGEARKQAIAAGMNIQD